MELMLPNFSLNLEFKNFQNDTSTPNQDEFKAKKSQKPELDKSVKQQKIINTSRSIQFARRAWQTWLERSEFVDAEKKLIEVYTKQELSKLLKHFFWEGTSVDYPCKFHSCIYYTTTSKNSFNASGMFYGAKSKILALTSTLHLFSKVPIEAFL